ncbi:MAG: hypothetical protein A2V70_08055 [Planctomycetes bacterium RBG_13_63_9]|nr:MAG: hypothetical protein A2V70_08055 [Planctomycetes bacterium RBG_13_63_9]
MYFPTSADSAFPKWSTYGTSPLAAFDVADLDSTIGTTAQLRNRILELVTQDYCEFSVRVTQTTSTPSPTVNRWQIVGIGSDTNASVFGVAQAVDTDDGDPQDYARVFAGAFATEYGGAGGALNGTDSTLERWGTAIGHTVSHEAGHNYGLTHANSAPRPGTVEDDQNNHVLATASTGLTGEIRASVNRHFSDTSYEILAHNLGLNDAVLANWDFVNPNDKDAHSLTMTLLSTASSLSIGWFYKGSTSPWTNPTVSSTGTTLPYQGTSYNVFDLVFSVAKNWSGGTAGVVPPAGEFHVGATFNDAVVVYDVTLGDSGGNDLPLHPRMVGFDAGAADVATGDFSLTFFNTRPDDGPLQLVDLEIQYTPRLASIDSMVAGAVLSDVHGMPIALRPTLVKEPFSRSYEVSRPLRMPLAQFNQARHVDLTYVSVAGVTEIELAKPAGDAIHGELIYPTSGTAVSLFPSTGVYVKATVVDPSARYFDPQAKRFVNGPLESHVFYQFAGYVPDLNRNGIDDLLDIRQLSSWDRNTNGIPDEAERFIDSFESYGTIDDLRTAWEAGSGSQVSLSADPGLYHWGKQSLVLDSSRSALSLPQAGFRFDGPQDWTSDDARGLTFWFRGDQNNNPAPLWIAVEDYAGIVAVVVHGDPNAVVSDTWQEWTVDFSQISYTRVRVDRVRRVSLGLGIADQQAGRSNIVYIDDIRLVPQSFIRSGTTRWARDLAAMAFVPKEDESRTGNAVSTQMPSAD